MTRGQIIEKIKLLGFEVKAITGTAWTAKKNESVFSAKSPMGLLKQIKAAGADK